jgi:hypothetical protein
MRKTCCSEAPRQKRTLFVVRIFLGSYAEKGALGWGWGGVAHGSTVAAPPMILRRQYEHNQIATECEKEPV